MSWQRATAPNPCAPVSPVPIPITWVLPASPKWWLVLHIAGGFQDQLRPMPSSKFTAMGEARALLASYCENHSSLEALGSVDISFLLKEMEGNWQKVHI